MFPPPLTSMENDSTTPGSEHAIDSKLEIESFLTSEHDRLPQPRQNIQVTFAQRPCSHVTLVPGTNCFVSAQQPPTSQLSKIASRRSTVGSVAPRRLLGLVFPYLNMLMLLMSLWLAVVDAAPAIERKLASWIEVWIEGAFKQSQLRGACQINKGRSKGWREFEGEAAFTSRRCAGRRTRRRKRGTRRRVQTCQIRKDGWIKEMVGIQKAAFASRSWRRKKNHRRHRRRKTCMKIGRSRKNE